MPLDRLKHKCVERRADIILKREIKDDFDQTVVESKDWIANLLESEKDSGAEFEREVIKHGARRFAEWIEKELKK